MSPPTSSTTAETWRPNHLGLWALNESDCCLGCGSSIKALNRRLLTRPSGGTCLLVCAASCSCGRSNRVNMGLQKYRCAKKYPQCLLPFHLQKCSDLIDLSFFSPKKTFNPFRTTVSPVTHCAFNIIPMTLTSWSHYWQTSVVFHQVEVNERCDRK